MNRDEFKILYDIKHPLYERLISMIRSTIEPQLQAEKIPYLHIDARIKTLGSSFEKLARKNYADPFTQVEDVCGVRVVCYYASDVERITAMLKNDFDVIRIEDTQSRMKPNEFGYRSTHLIISIPTDWLKVPQYRGLDDLKAEVQVRTVLMHAWAEIQHKLAYKSLEQVPDAYQRQLFRLSAKFEEADEQLEQIRGGLAAYRAKIKISTLDGLDSLKGKPLNLDTLTILLDKAYPDRKKSLAENSSLLSELMQLAIEMEDLVYAINEHASIANEHELLEQEKFGLGQGRRWAQVGAMRTALEVSNDRYYSSRAEDLDDEPMWSDPIRIARQMLHARNS